MRLLLLLLFFCSAASQNAPDVPKSSRGRLSKKISNWIKRGEQQLGLPPHPPGVFPNEELLRSKYVCGRNLIERAPADLINKDWDLAASKYATLPVPRIGGGKCVLGCVIDDTTNADLSREFFGEAWLGKCFNSQMNSVRTWFTRGRRRVEVGQTPVTARAPSIRDTGTFATEIDYINCRCGTNQFKNSGIVDTLREIDDGITIGKIWLKPGAIRPPTVTTPSTNYTFLSHFILFQLE